MLVLLLLLLLLAVLEGDACARAAPGRTRVTAHQRLAAPVFESLICIFYEGGAFGRGSREVVCCCCFLLKKNNSRRKKTAAVLAEQMFR